MVLNPKKIAVMGYGAVGRLKAQMYHEVFPEAKISAYDTQKLENVPDYVRVVGSVDEAIRG
ncbi:MAG: hypothetical protein QGH47_06565, partial [Candidatus Woesearchaeota archaeon]|nr:hypothetical protein [Candidatus Woesearchaeota archaeon]